MLRKLKDAAEFVIAVVFSIGLVIAIAVAISATIAGPIVNWSLDRLHASYPYIVSDPTTYAGYHPARIQALRIILAVPLAVAGFYLFGVALIIGDRINRFRKQLTDDLHERWQARLLSARMRQTIAMAGDLIPAGRLLCDCVDTESLRNLAIDLGIPPEPVRSESSSSQHRAHRISIFLSRLLEGGSTIESQDEQKQEFEFTFNANATTARVINELHRRGELDVSLGRAPIETSHTVSELVRRVLAESGISDDQLLASLQTKLDDVNRTALIGDMRRKMAAADARRDRVLVISRWTVNNNEDGATLRLAKLLAGSSELDVPSNVGVVVHLRIGDGGMNLGLRRARITKRTDGSQVWAGILGTPDRLDGDVLEVVPIAVFDCPIPAWNPS